jgi:fatty acid elongase 3
MAIFYIEYFFLDRRQRPVKYLTDNVVYYHNLLLSISSVFMFFGLLRFIVLLYLENGIYGLICGINETGDEPSTYIVNGVVFWCWIFYISKYYELLDIILVQLRGKYVSYLQIHHHIGVIFLVYLGLVYSHCLGWVVVLNNSFVHSIMYYYYAQTSIGRTPWWKKYLTQLQLGQFYLDFVLSCPFLFYLGDDNCKSSVIVWIYGSIFGASLIYLFLEFYNVAYRENVIDKVSTKENLRMTRRPRKSQ